jgi:hypothetical protein
MLESATKLKEITIYIYIYIKIAGVLSVKVSKCSDSRSLMINKPVKQRCVLEGRRSVTYWCLKQFENTFDP